MPDGVTEVLSSGQNAIAAFACANCPSHKGEDFHAHKGSDDGGFECYIILDGHGGSQAGVTCQEFMAKRAVELYEEGGKKFEDADVYRLFEETSARAKAVKDFSGTTATCVFLRLEENGDVNLLLAWVGDSRGIICKDKKLVVETIDHKLTNPSEKERVLKATNNNVMVLTPLSDTSLDPATPPKLDLGEAANPGTNKSKGATGKPRAAEGTGARDSEDITVKGGGLFHKLKVDKGSLPKPRPGRTDSDDSDLEDVTVKGGNAYRKRSVDMRNPQESPTPDSPELGRALSNQKPTPFDARRGSFIAQRITTDGTQKGAWCLFSGTNGTSLAVTRSLGDADAARSCIAVPEIKRMKIQNGESTRFVLCSDGVWDVLTSMQVTKRVANITNQSSAARRIALISKERRYNVGAGKDDITVLVGDVFAPPPNVGCTACTIS
mmetsp:Transcript_1487/g.3290  ORF Transcript_1487/g.3290 Transcript_1487/m.3290 type:complete len:437 (-) Transcript_1487:170-1480(-)